MPQGNSNTPWRIPPRGTWPSGDPRQRKQLISGSLSGAPVAKLPIVLTVGVNGITNTSANIIGSVNPNGLATSWWLAWGTTLPLSPGTTTAPVALGSGTTPITVTISLTGLTAGTTYYVAIVGQSAAGTVYGQTLSFVPTVPLITTPPTAPYGQPFVTIPHFNVPFSIVTTGNQSGAVVVEQDTLQEIEANVTTVALCGIGQCPQIPSFGIPSLAFSTAPPDMSELISAIQLWEPRANEDATSQILTDSNWGVTLTTSYTGAQGV